MARASFGACCRRTPSCSSGRCAGCPSSRTQQQPQMLQQHAARWACLLMSNNLLCEDSPAIMRGGARASCSMLTLNNTLIKQQRTAVIEQHAHQTTAYSSDEYLELWHSLLCAWSLPWSCKGQLELPRGLQSFHCRGLRGDSYKALAAICRTSTAWRAIL